MPIRLLKNEPLYDGAYRADIGRLLVKLPNGTQYISVGSEIVNGESVTLLLVSSKPRAEMVEVDKTINGWLKINMFNFKYRLPSSNHNVILKATGYDVDNDVYVYRIIFA
jgi:hypothetical protein